MTPDEPVAVAEPVPIEEACVLGHGQPTKRYIGLLCTRHYHWGYRTLDEITELYALLPIMLIPGPAGDGRHGTRVGSPAPGNLDVMAITDHGRDEHGNPRIRPPADPGDELWYEGQGSHVPAVIPALESWALMVLEEREGTDALDGTLTTAVRVLRREHKWIAAQAWVDDYANELTSLHRALARAIGDTMWPKPIGRCPNDQTRLYNTIGLDQVTCRKCGTVWAGVHLARLKLIFEQEKQREAEA